MWGKEKKSKKTKKPPVLLKNILTELIEKSKIYKKEARYGLFNLPNTAILSLSEMATIHGT